MGYIHRGLNHQKCQTSAAIRECEKLRNPLSSDDDRRGLWERERDAGSDRAARGPWRLSPRFDLVLLYGPRVYVTRGSGHESSRDEDEDLQTQEKFGTLQKTTALSM